MHQNGKILVVGSWVTNIYEEPLSQALKEYTSVITFPWAPFFRFEILSNRYNTNSGLLKSIWYRIQNKYAVGPSVRKLNQALIKKVSQEQPDYIFLYRPVHIAESTLLEIKRYSKILIYNNDDPFTKKLPWYTYRHFFKALKHADWIFSYRQKNIDDYAKLGFKNTSILRSNYLKNIHFPIPDEERVHDITFIGHFEDDGRDKIILDLLKLPDLNVSIHGTNWERSKYYSEICDLLGTSISGIYNEDYNKKLNQSKSALIFFSKINNDQYTRRCFEIPATKTAILCEYTDEMQSLFKEGEEAIYFRDNNQLLQMINHYFRDPSKLSNIAEAGFKRVQEDGHEISNRAKQILLKCEELS